MALVYARNAQEKYADTPTIKQASRQSYGRQRIIFDTVDFADTPVVANDYIVLYDPTEAQSLYEFNFATGNDNSDLATGTLGYYDGTDDVFTPLTSAITLPTTAGEQVPSSGLTDAEWVAAIGRGAWVDQSREHTKFLVLRADAAGTVGQLTFQATIAVD